MEARYEGALDFRLQTITGGTCERGRRTRWQLGSELGFEHRGKSTAALRRNGGR